MTPSVVPPPPGSTGVPPRVIDVLLRALKAEGVNAVFGIPGGLRSRDRAGDDEAGPPITKNSAMVTSPESMARHRRPALTGRRGPAHAARQFNPGSLDCVRYERPLGVAAIARAMGLAAWVVESPGKIQGARRQALAVPGPTLIEVRVDPSVAPPLGDRVKAIRVRGGLR